MERRALSAVFFCKRELSALTSRAMRLASWLLPCMALSSRPTPLPLTSRFRFPSRRATTLLMSEADAKAAWLAKQQNPPGSQNVRNNLLGRTGDAKKIEAAAEAAQASAAEATANRALLAELKRQAVAAAQGSMGGPPPGMGGPPPGMGGPPPGMGGPPPGAMEVGNAGPRPGRMGEFRAQGGRPMPGRGRPPPGVGRPPPGAMEAGNAGPRPGRMGEFRAFVPPPSDERQGRSPGLQNNFYKVASSDFRRAYGGDAAPPPSDAPYGGGAGVSGFDSPAQPPAGYGAESPLPGREGEYEAFRAQGGVAGAGRAFVPPPIGEERQGRSPGLQNNFYEVASSDFRRAYGGDAAPPPSDAPYGAGAGEYSAGSPAQPPAGYGAEIPMPGMDGPPPGMGGLMPGMGGPQLGSPMPASAAQDDGLQVRMQQLEQSNERLQLALSRATPASTAQDDGLQARMQQLERSNERQDDGLQERMQQLERSNERLQLALSGVREREEAAREREGAARREVVEITAREEALSQRLAAIEARLAGGGNRWALDTGTASSTAGEALASGTTIADPSRMSLPEKVDMIQERLGLAPGGESLVAAVMEASEVAGVANEGGPLVVQVDRLMVKLFGRSGRG